MSKPNLFQLATKELSQDGFISWLLLWANKSNAPYNKELNETAKDFVRLLLGKGSSYAVETVSVEKQWNDIDIWADINDSEAIIIEDKTDTSEHDNQLVRYKEIAERECANTRQNLHCVYLKTGNESLSVQEQIEKKGYTVVRRSSLLSLLESHNVKNDIYNDFVDSLKKIEAETNDYSTVDKIYNSWRACEGFYIHLQKEIPEWSDWGYVANASGGFKGFWYHWNESSLFSEVYIQIENGGEAPKLVIKVAGSDITVENLYSALDTVVEIGREEGLIIEKPYRYRAGNTSTLAIVRDAFREETFSINSFIDTLHALERVVDKYCENN